jgi:hypothetical protein
MKTDIQPDKAYSAALSKLHELEQDLVATERRREMALIELSELGAERASDSLTSAALRLLDGQDAAATPEARRGALREEAVALDDKRRILRRAVELARPLVETEHRRWSAAVVQKVRPSYAAAAKAIAAMRSEMLSTETAWRGSAREWCRWIPWIKCVSMEMATGWPNGGCGTRARTVGLTEGGAHAAIDEG